MLKPLVLATSLIFCTSVLQAAPLSKSSVEHVEQLMSEQHLDDALLEIKSLIKKDPGNPKMHYYLAQVYAAQGQWSNASAMLKKAQYFDWRWKFASSKSRVSELEELIAARIKNPYPGVVNTPEHDEFRRSEKKLAMEPPLAELPPKLLTETAPPLFLMMEAPPVSLQATTPPPKQRTFLWIFASVVAGIGLAMVVVVRRFNIVHLQRKLRLEEAALKEQRIVLLDLLRVLNDVETISRFEKLSHLNNEINTLLVKVKKLIMQLNTNELQNIGDIEHYVRTTRLYREHCYNYEDLAISSANDVNSIMKDM